MIVLRRADLSQEILRGYNEIKMSDYLDMDWLLSDEEKLVRQTARRFVSLEVQPLIREAFSEGKFPMELVQAFGKMGFLGTSLEGYGCAGMSSVDYGLIMQELEHCDSGIRSFASGH